MVRNLGGLCLAASLAPVLAVTTIRSTKSYSMNRQELIRDASGFGAHALISEKNNVAQRVMHAIFEGNSGGYIEFYPEGLHWNGTGQFYFPLVSPIDGLETKVNPNPESSISPKPTFNVTSDFNLNFNSYAIYSVASSVRNIRDWSENTDPGKGANPNAGQFTIRNNMVSLRHEWPGPTQTSLPYYVQVDLVPVVANSVTFAEKIITQEAGLDNYQTFSVQLTDPSRAAVLRMTTSTNQPQEVPIDITEVLQPEYQQDDLAEGLAFLSHQSGWVAGSFRFLTYFGRDTLMTLMMLKDKVTDTMFKTVVTAALARTRLDSTEPGTLEHWADDYSADNTGLMCHEDEVGAFPWQNTKEPLPWRGDYKMLDSHFLVLPLLGYAEDSGKFVVTDYLKEQAARRLDGTMKPIGDMLEANIKQILKITQPFAEDPKYTKLLSIYHDTVGNWRDSNEGLYRGRYPMDVNAAFAPAALQVIADHGDKWFPGKGYSDRAKTYVTVWKKNALEFFKVAVPSKSALDASIKGYVNDKDVTVRQGDLSGSLAQSTQNDLPSQYFITLSILNNGKQTGVLSTDYGLLLAYRDDLPEDVVAEAARAARVKFPRGLATDAGLVVSNPAYAYQDGITEQGLVIGLDRTGYHGTVVWSWQHAMYNLGLKNYLEKYPNSGVQEALNVLWDSIDGNMDMVESEMWSWQVNAQTGDFKAKDLLELTGSGTEGNVAQLWSYAFIGESRPAAVPESTTTVPESTTTVPESTTTVPEPTTTVPEPTTTVPEPTTTVPEPTTTVPEPTTTVPEPELTSAALKWVSALGCGSLLVMLVSLVA